MLPRRGCSQNHLSLGASKATLTTGSTVYCGREAAYTFLRLALALSGAMLMMSARDCDITD